MTVDIMDSVLASATYAPETCKLEYGASKVMSYYASTTLILAVNNIY